MKLVIVESPTKAKTISKFLGEEYQVESSYGHVRDLPKSQLGIDPENNFEPKYIIPLKAKPRVTALKKAAEKSSGVILATDEDREGEAIAWHLVQALGLNESRQPPAASSQLVAGRRKLAATTERIVFHEITARAIEDALKSPRSIDMNLVDAQQARRVLDRLVGYKLSPFLWKKIARGLSAGRVQSVALRLIAEREEEIKNFKPEEYWTISAMLQKLKIKKTIEAALYKINGEVVPKLGIRNKDEAEKIARELEKSKFKVTAVEKKELRRNPLPPFITSTLQQAAVSRLSFSAKKIMVLAQSLYENGHITYMRTDSVNLSNEALAAAKRWIEKNLPAEYGVNAPRVFKGKSRLAQEAHEAIRPTEVGNQPEKLKLGRDEGRLYDLIWRRFLASQLPQAVFDATHVEIEAKNSLLPTSYSLLTNGSTLRFDGFLKIWQMKFEEKELPLLEKDESLKLVEVKPEQHFTEPPPRYNEASLIKTLEKYGIGRPSTYAPTISVIQERNYVEKREGRFYLTEIGTMVNGLLTEHFPEVVDIQFTAKMEEELDEIAEGKEKWQDIIRQFYEPFAKHLEGKYETVERQNSVAEATGEICEKCGKPMVIRFGRFGRFLACSGFPECKNTKPLLKDAPKEIGMKCPKCGKGEVVERRVSRGRARGKMFWGCSRYPDCDYASWENPSTLRQAQDGTSSEPQSNSEQSRTATSKQAPSKSEKRYERKRTGPKKF